ncbi:MAG TPA: LamG-like jellyroll fold domain-containing protein [Gemmataceae bacterium]|nr:LamG-like jellyroll fold domain-containing protein [Gemmataceae bacterium]
MSQPLGNLDELRGLLDALCEETITPEQVARLEELVLRHPEAEAFYVQYMGLYADLSRHFVPTPAATEQSLAERLRSARPAQARPTRRRRAALWGVIGLAAAAAGLLLVLGPWRRPARLAAPEPAAEPTDTSVAVLLQASEAVWDEPEFGARPGAPLPPGTLRLKSGLAHIEFYSGATVILEGPAELELISPTEAFCVRGKLRATVPPQAQGFTVRSPRLDLVDRGTEFGLRVDGGGRTEVHVFQGKVELYDANTGLAPASRRELTTGGGLSLQGPGPARRIAPAPAAFRTARDVETARAAEVLRQQKRWRDASAALRRDPSLRVYYPFEADPAGGRTLRDQAGGRREPLDGAIVGCTWAVGRWPGKQGLEFKRVSDRVRLHVPGEFDALTLMAWVRVDALPNRFHSLLMTDSWDEAAPHWHISADGKLELGVQGPRRRNGVHYYSPAVFPPDRLGQWTHLAVVHDRDAGLVTHYVDGQPVSQEPIKLDVALRLGNAEVGNWNLAARRHNHPVRYFSGCIDEFLLFSRALDEQEVARLYEQGRPPS